MTAAPATKKRGRSAQPSKDAAEPPKKRGRPAKTTVAVGDEADEEEEEDSPVESPKKRGRSSKADTAASQPSTKKPSKASVPAKATSVPSKKRGRPIKVATAELEPAEDEEKEAGEDVTEAEPPKKRGRPSKKATTAAAPVKKEAAATQPAKKRGRPSRIPTEPAEAPDAPDTPAPRKRHSGATGGPTTKIASDAADAADQLEEELVDEATKSAKKGGRRNASSFDEDAVEDGKNYWLMKAEQVDRMETLQDGSQFNTKFTIDDLKLKNAPEPWEGVRNMVARNNMRAMKQGDLAFFYASQGKQPGITGIIEVVKEHEADFTVTDEGSIGYVEPAKRGKHGNQWSLVHVEFRKKLSKPVTLKQLQKFSNPNGILSNMQVVNQSRLSVSRVSEKEWDFIVENLIEGYEDDAADDNDDDDDDSLAGVKVRGSDPLNPKSNPGAMKEPESEDKAVQAIAGAVEEPELRLPSEVNDLPITGAVVTDEVPTSGTALPLTTHATSRPSSRHGPRPLPRAGPQVVSRQGSLAPPAIMETKESVADVFAAVSDKDAALNGLLKPAGRASSRAPSLQPFQRGGSREPSVRPGSRASSLQPFQSGGSREPSARPGSRGISKTPNAGLMAPFKEAVEEEEAMTASFEEQEALMLA